MEWNKIFKLVIAGLAAGWAAAESGQAADTAGDAAFVAKLNHYVSAHNVLTGMRSLRFTCEDFEARSAPAALARMPMSVSTGSISQAAGDLKAGRAAPGEGASGLDALADRYIPVLTQLEQRLSDLETYYRTHADLEDKNAHGAAERPLVLADCSASEALLDQLSGELDAVEDKQELDELASMKTAGDTIGYDHGTAMRTAKSLLQLVTSAPDKKDAAMIAKADGLAASLASMVTTERSDMDAAQPASPGQRRYSDYREALKRLDNLVGAYRNMKQYGPQGGTGGMVSMYNEAVRETNKAVR